MSSVWPLTKLGDVLRPTRRGEPVDPLREYRLLGVRLDGHGPFLRETVLGTATSAGRLFRVAAGDFICSRLFAWRGAFGVVPGDLDGCYVSGEFLMYEPVADRLDVQFLRLWFRLPGTLDRVAEDCSGSTPLTRNRFKEQFLLSLEMPLPPLAEQQRIVARIEGVAGKVNEARVLRQQAADEAKALTRSAAKRVFDEALVGCSQMRLADWVSVCGGGTPAKTNPTYWQGIIPWVSPKDMKQREIWESQDHISEHATIETAAKLIQPGAVLVVVRGMILAHTFPSAVLKVPAAINQDMKALIPRPGLLPDYLCAFLWGYNRRVLELVEKSTHDTRKLQTPHLLDIKIHSPTVDQQHRILAHLGELERKAGVAKCLQAEAAAELDTLLPAILDCAFKGEL